MKYLVSYREECGEINEYNKRRGVKLQLVYNTKTKTILLIIRECDFHYCDSGKYLMRGDYDYRYMQTPLETKIEQDDPILEVWSNIIYVHKEELVGLFSHNNSIEAVKSLVGDLQDTWGKYNEQLEVIK